MKEKIRIAWALIYVVAVVPFLFLKWFYFNSDIDTPVKGTDLFMNLPGILFFVIAFALILLSAKHALLALSTIIMLGIQIVAYLYQFCFWYEARITGFSLATSFDTAHMGFYVALAAIVCYSVIFGIYMNHYLMKLQTNLS